MMYAYYRLESRKHKGWIVRKNDQRTSPDFLKDEYFDAKTQNWVQIGIMTHYFWPESDTYDMYTELTESEALAAIRAMTA